MGSSQEEFVELRRLLAAKRAEQPPPGYFNTFASKVVARIEAENLAAPEPWWVRWFAPASWTPGLVTANTAIVTGLALLGGTAWYFKSRPDRKPDLETARSQVSPVDSTQTAPPRADIAMPQLSSFGSLPILRVGSREGLVQSQPASSFHLPRPSLSERIESTETEVIPAGIFEPWARDRGLPERGLPTSIVHHVESRR